MEDPIHDYATVVNEAERQRRILEELERSEAEKPVLTAGTKVFLGLVALVVLGVVTWKFARPWIMMEPVATDTPPVESPVGNPGDPSPGTGTGTGTGTNTTPAKKAVVKCEGRLGDEITTGSVIFNALALNIEPTNRKDVQVAGLLALVGNGGEQAMRAPGVSVFLFDSSGRQYSSRPPEGVYRAGSELNPLIKQNARWVFIVPTGIELVRAQIQAAGAPAISVDLTKRSDSLDVLLADAETAVWLGELDQSIKKAVDEQFAQDPERVAAKRAAEARIEAERAQAKTLAAKQEVAAHAHQAVTDQQAKVDDIAVQLAAAKKAQVTAEKHAKNLADGLAKAQNNFDSATASLAAAKQEQIDANNALQPLSDDWKRHNVILVKPMEVRLNKAIQAVERWTTSVENTKDALDEKRKVSTAADADLSKLKNEATRLSSQSTNEEKSLEQLQKQADAIDAEVLKMQGQ